MNLQRRIAAALGSSGVRGIVSAYLFGSHVRGGPHQDSDLDLGLLLNREEHRTRADRFDTRLILSARLSDTLESPVDVVILNDVPPTLGRHVVTHGTRVHCSDEELDHAFVRNVQLRAADLEPFLRRTRRRKLETLGR